MSLDSREALTEHLEDFLEKEAIASSRTIPAMYLSSAIVSSALDPLRTEEHKAEYERLSKEKKRGRPTNLKRNLTHLFDSDPASGLDTILADSSRNIHTITVDNEKYYRLILSKTKTPRRLDKYQLDSKKDKFELELLDEMRKEDLLNVFKYMIYSSLISAVRNHDKSESTHVRPHTIREVAKRDHKSEIEAYFLAPIMYVSGRDMELQEAANMLLSDRMIKYILDNEFKFSELKRKTIVSLRRKKKFKETVYRPRFTKSVILRYTE